MNTEELLRPRWKLIADYPDNPDKIGAIYNPEYYLERNIAFFDKYPHLFKKLQWWEDRKPEEMPEYVKHPRFDDVFKIVSIETKYMSVYLDDETFPRSLAHFIPATKEEYLTFKSKTA